MAVALDKWIKLKVAPEQILLGLLFNTRRMNMGITKDYRKQLLKLLTKTCHSERESFTVPEIENDWSHWPSIQSNLPSYATSLWICGIRITRE